MNNFVTLTLVTLLALSVGGALRARINDLPQSSIRLLRAASRIGQGVLIAAWVYALTALVLHGLFVVQPNASGSVGAAGRSLVSAVELHMPWLLAWLTIFSGLVLFASRLTSRAIIEQDANP